MLTLLFLIHRWFYAKPNPYYFSQSESSQVVPQENLNPEFDFKSRNYKNQHPNLLNFRGITYPSKSYPFEVALVAVCRISTTAWPLGNLEVSNAPFSDLAKMSAEERFQAAVKVIHSLPKDGPYQPSNSTKLKFYGLYKQATEGKATGSRPGFWDVIGRAKWDAWNKVGDVSKDEAKTEYVDCLKEIVETMSFNGNVEDFLDSIGPFYEFVTLQGNEMNHIKEKLEEVSSSSGSSLSPSVEASKQNSPIKMSQMNGNEEEGEDEEEEIETTSDKAEVDLETSTCAYEAKSQKSAHIHQNGFVTKLSKDSNEDEVVTPPPAPVHSLYSKQNGFVNRSLRTDHDDDEVLTVSAPYVNCKEDLEQEVDDSVKGHNKVRVTSSIETVTTSGTESEKYYSGDSEPEIDDKFVSSPLSSTLAIRSECFPSTSAAATQQTSLGSQIGSVEHASPLKKSITTSPIKKSKERVSPKSSSSTPRQTQPDIVVQQTVERLNRDVDHILARLRILEAAYSVSVEGARLPSGDQNQSSSTRRRRRIFGELSPQSIAFIVMWPFVAQFLIKLIRWWWRRRRGANLPLRY